jgi:hypothetical protein
LWKAQLHLISLNRPAFFLFAGLFGIAAVGMLTIDLNFKPPAEKLMKNVISLLKNVELDVLLAVCVASGKNI